VSIKDNDSKRRGERLREELRNYALISAYLFVCFAIILLYDASTQVTGTQQPVSWSAALIKALVLGKFILIGDALSVGARARHHALLYRVVWKSVAMLFLLIVFKGLEELVVGWMRGSTTVKIFGEFLERTWLQDLAPVLLMLLILVPMIAASEIYRAVGASRFREFLTQT
jgi:hypothetical protein